GIGWRIGVLDVGEDLVIEVGQLGHGRAVQAVELDHCLPLTEIVAVDVDLTKLVAHFEVEVGAVFAQVGGVAQALQCDLGIGGQIFNVHTLHLRAGLSDAKAELPLAAVHTHGDAGGADLGRSVALAGVHGDTFDIDLGDGAAGCLGIFALGTRATERYRSAVFGKFKRGDLRGAGRVAVVRHHGIAPERRGALGQLKEGLQVVVGGQLG